MESTRPRSWRSAWTTATPAAKRWAGVSRVMSRPLELHAPVARDRQPGDHVDELGLAIALDAGHPDDLPGAERELLDGQSGLGGARSLDTHAVEREEDLARCRLGRRARRELDVAADHRVGDGALRELAPLRLQDLLSAAEHDDAVGHVSDLAELVRDDDHGAPLVGSLSGSCVGGVAGRAAPGPDRRRDRGGASIRRGVSTAVGSSRTSSRAPR